jgi:hypothetical protein
VATENRHTRILRTAALTAGGLERLAATPPFDVFSRALDIVARGPLGPKRR